MTTLYDLAHAYATAHPKRDGGSWHGYCQSLAYRFIQAQGHGAQGFDTAGKAADASGPLNPNPAEAKPGAFHFWKDSGAGHVAIELGGNRLFMASGHLQTVWGDAIGVANFDWYRSQYGGRYVGWSMRNGTGVLHVPDNNPNPAPAPVSNDQATVQQALKTLHLYDGPVDGAMGVQSWKGVQTFLKQRGLYSGALDGAPGVNTFKGFQTFAKTGGYSGPIDGVLGNNSWAGFAAGIKKVSAPAPAPVPAPTKPVTPQPVVPTQPVVPVQPIAPVTPTQPVTPKPAPVVPAQPVQPEPVKPAEPQSTPKPEEKPLSAEEIAKQTEEISSLPTVELGAIIPSATGRKVAYGAYMAVSLLVTNAAVAYAALGSSFPAWLVVSIAVVGNLATPFGALAIANATTKK